MANIAQTVNVLQAIILTEGEKMVLTPTYHVFDLYQDHMDARQLDCVVEAETVGAGEFSLTGVTASASEKDGKITLTLSNLNADEGEEILVHLKDGEVTAAEGRILTGRMDQYNDFGKAELAVEPFADFTVEKGELKVRMPACSVAELRLS